MLAALAAMVLGYIGVFFGRLLQAAVSRHRERLADASAVQFTRNPVGLTGALLKIAGASAGSRLVAPEAEEVAHMLFAAGLPRLFATHPPLEERLKALDPSFRASELPKLAAEAARDSERQRADDAARPPGFAPDAASASALARAADRSIRGHAAHDIAALAGTIANENVRYAENARVAIPEGLRDFVDSADHARALMLVVLASKIPEVQAEQRRILEAAYGPEFTARVFGMQALADSLAPALRLPAVQQLFPALRRLSLAERQRLRDVVAQLANADSRIDVFECCLTLLLAANLDDLEAGPMHGSASLHAGDRRDPLACSPSWPCKAQATMRAHAAPTRRASRWCCPNIGQLTSRSRNGRKRWLIRWRAWPTCVHSPRKCSSRGSCVASPTIRSSRWKKASCCAQSVQCCIARCRRSSRRPPRG